MAGIIALISFWLFIIASIQIAILSCAFMVRAILRKRKSENTINSGMVKLAHGIGLILLSKILLLIPISFLFGQTALKVTVDYTPFLMSVPFIILYTIGFLFSIFGLPFLLIFGWNSNKWKSFSIVYPIVIFETILTSMFFLLIIEAGMSI